MRLSRMFAYLAGAVAIAAVANAIDAKAATLSLVGSSTKVCQLIGDTDWATGAPTAARTFTNFGLAGVDLGFPVDSGPSPVDILHVGPSGPLYFLFGDSVPDGHPPGSIATVPPDDALGFTERTALPDSTTCLNLQLAVSAPKTFAHPTVHPPIQQGSFNVPTGGVFLNDSLYAFFWTDHCASAEPLAPNPTEPLTLPPANEACPEVPASNLVGRSVLAAASPKDPINFYRAVPHQFPPFPPDVLRFTMPSGFVYVSATQPPPERRLHPGLNFPNLEQDEEVDWIPVFAVPRYRASIPYLALAPRATFGHPATWSFFAGTVGQHPLWVTRAQWESAHVNGQWTPPAGAEIYADANPGERCIGEHQVTWNAPLEAWLLLYNCSGSIEARLAPEPWGPWSAATVILSPQDPGVVCTLIESQTGCTGLTPFGIGAGFFYAPFVLNRFTRPATPAGEGQPRQATIYWLVSTWDPYVIVVMRSTLTLQP
jgi:Domain of unknown function (DUF4185)